MIGLCYKIYKTRYKTNLTTNLGKICLDIFIILEKLNIYLKELFFNKSYNIEFPLELRVFFGEFKILIDSIIKEIDTDNSSKTILINLDRFIYTYSKMPYCNYLISILGEFRNSLRDMYIFSYTNINNISLFNIWF